MKVSRTPPIDPAPALILFDLDDTLCDYAAARQIRLQLAFSYVLKESGVAISDAALEQLIDDSIALSPHGVEHFAVLLQPFAVDQQAVSRAGEWYRENRFHGLALFDDALLTLQSVRSMDRKIGIITNGPADVQAAKLDLLGLRPYVDFVLISGEFGVAKPDPAIFQEGLRQGGASASSAIVIGDSIEFDMTGAHHSHIRAIWVNRLGGGWDSPLPAPAHVVPDLAGVRRLLIPS